MGSGGTGRLSDYSKKIQSEPDASPGKSGDTSGGDRCTENFTATLEEVARNPYSPTTGLFHPTALRSTVKVAERLVVYVETNNLGYSPAHTIIQRVV